MGGDKSVTVRLSRTEADEILSRLLKSPEGDTDAFQTALLALVDALSESTGDVAAEALASADRLAA